MNTKISISIEELIVLVDKQISNFWNDALSIRSYINQALDLTFDCFKKTKNKHYRNENGCLFSPYHSGQYSIFLYYLANTVFTKDNNIELASKIYYLNKIMNSVDWYYEIKLPSYFGVEHPVGSILGRANYSNGLFIYQGCTVGGSRGINDKLPKYPKIGNNLIMYSNTTVLGNSNIGDNVVLSTGTTVVNQDVPNNCFVFGTSPNLIIKLKESNEMENYISNIWCI